MLWWTFVALELRILEKLNKFNSRTFDEFLWCLLYTIWLNQNFYQLFVIYLIIILLCYCRKSVGLEELCESMSRKDWLASVSVVILVTTTSDVAKPRLLLSPMFCCATLSFVFLWGNCHINRGLNVFIVVYIWLMNFYTSMYEIHVLLYHLESHRFYTL